MTLDPETTGGGKVKPEGTLAWKNGERNSRWNYWKKWRSGERSCYEMDTSICKDPSQPRRMANQ